jgi:TRAP-type C4-dicarboxylate transport system permease small subunit
MLTLEVNGQFITWPEDFAVIMMGYYKKFGIPYAVHRNCLHFGSNNVS